MNTTVEQAIERFAVTVDEHLDRQATVPVVDFARQGDVIVIPSRIARDALPAMTPVPAHGVPVVRGENGGNTHLLLADGDVRFDARTASATDLTLGRLTVGEGSTAYLAHPEHGYVGIVPGTYTVRRQREQADELRMVAD